jgi:NitT/TauT family transport system permease protein
MFAARSFCSLLFTFTYATLAAKSRRAELVLIPVLDILQSVPILGFLTFTVVFFMNLFPGQVLGAELAAIFAIFTSQAWNMAFSIYQSLTHRAGRPGRGLAQLPPRPAGSGSGGWKCRSPCRAWSGTR